MPKDIGELDLVGIISFDGATKNGLRLHPDQEHLIYPMGNKVTIKDITSGKQSFLTGHTNLISTLCVSVCGKLVASGQINHLGFKAMVIIWDYESRKMLGSYEIHKVKVEDLCFSCDGNFLISLGGRDDGNIVIWDVNKNEAICGSFASSETSGNAFTITKTNLRDQCFVTGGENTLKVWRINPESRKVYGMNVKVGKLKRSINCIVINEKDEEALCGTTSGDIIKARLNYYRDKTYMEPAQPPIMVGCYSKIPKDPKKRKTGEGDLYGGGVTNLLLLEDGRVVVGAGDGTVEIVKILDAPLNTSTQSVKLPNTPQLKAYQAENVRSQVTSMALHKGEFILIGTVFCEIYQIRLSDFDMRLLVTCHTNTIYDIAFPHNYSEVFATSSKNDIRVWRLETQKELLRISVLNFICTSVCFSFDGGMIISGWNDGLIRAFTPQTGRLIFAIHNAHIKAVSAIVITMDGRRIVSGGCDGQLRIWSIRPDVQRLEVILKEHRGPITSLHISNSCEEVVSSSTDGTCIIWDIIRCSRKQVLIGNNMYLSARFSPNAVQILTCGTDRKIAYWETLDGSLVREIEGSSVGALNCLDISADGEHFITGSNDSILKVWEYHTADTTHIGLGHAAIITACKFSPDNKHIVTVSADGAIMIWRCPFVPSLNKINKSKDVNSVRSRSTCSLKEEEWKKLKLPELENGGENVAAISSRSEAAESVKAIHEGDALAIPCKCDPLKPSLNSCKCKGENKTPFSERGSVKSNKSVSSTCSKLNRSEGTAKSNKVVPREKLFCACANSGRQVNDTRRLSESNRSISIPSNNHGGKVTSPIAKKPPIGTCKAHTVLALTNCGK
ncbi:cilia- and flagella-associated protein 52 [Orussus abietinus]|uniref:cilia- and flagella-associated protein 52 n=1 Tax=Orussus abietinus TaxID=222816 RepID=UPI0006252CA5|nr:cilia- and flagella-associated protein 52 [Orussus abietinus]